MPKTAEDYLANSQCAITLGTKAGDLERLQIEFIGQVGDIPSLKNSKMPKTNFMNPQTKLRIGVMDILFAMGAAKLRFKKRITFGSQPVALLVVCKSRSRSFDPDNVLATVKDWLEPRFKQVGRQRKNRGWGVGVVDNDSQITGICIKDSDLGLNLDKTIIVVRRFNANWNKMQDVINEFFMRYEGEDNEWVVN